MSGVAIPESFRQSPRWWHDEQGRAWLDELPSLVGRMLEGWELRPDGTPRHGSNALVVPVLGDAGRAALRLTPPDERAAAELRALRFWRDGPVVQVLRAEPDGSAVLLERLDAGRPLASRPMEEVATVLGGLVAQLAVPSPPADVPSTSALAADLAATATARWRALGEPVDRRAVETAVALARSLADDDPGLAVNGDAHADQVLAGGRHRWTVIDPVLLRGDPAYDLARTLWTQADRLATAAAIRDCAATLVAATGFDEARSRAWLTVRTVDCLLWGLERGLTEDPVRCRRVLEALAP